MRGLGEARSMGDHGRLSLGVKASMTSAYGVLDYSHRVGNFAAFARGFGGMTKNMTGWDPELGVITGIGINW